MPILLIMIILSFPSHVFAEEYGTEILVYDDLGGVQAANYLSENIALEFLERLFQSPGPLKSVVDNYKAKLCGDLHPSHCGEAYVHPNFFKIAYYRGGWDAAVISYRVFVIWEDKGTGRATYPLMELDIQQAVEAEKTNEKRFKATLTTEIAGAKIYDSIGDGFGDYTAFSLPRPPWKGESHREMSVGEVPTPPTSMITTDSNRYLNMIEKMIDSKWMPPFKDQNLPSVVITFRIFTSGEISNIEIEKSSGNDEYDSAALRAVQEVNPLPAIPSDVQKSFIDVTYHFLVRE